VPRVSAQRQDFRSWAVVDSATGPPLVHDRDVRGPVAPVARKIATFADPWLQTAALDSPGSADVAMTLPWVRERRDLADPPMPTLALPARTLWVARGSRPPAHALRLTPLRLASIP